MAHRRLPPLNALKTFEAAARHCSLTGAAKELNVTQGAVSRQVKLLEDELGIPLFHRLHRKVVLTDAGRVLLPHLTQLFDHIANVTRNLTRKEHELTLRVQPTFALRWLLPRLPQFQKAHPDFVIRLMIDSRGADFRNDEIDAAIVYGTLDAQGLEQEPIHTERVTPVCAPGLLDGSLPLGEPADLVHHRLLLNSAESKEWRIWAQRAGVENLPLHQGQVFDLDDAAFQAAATGLGVALGDILLVHGDLRNGRLVAPFPEICAQTEEYHFTVPAMRSMNAATTAFRTWLLNELCISREKAATDIRCNHSS